ncbi:MAG: hypothetical protein OEY30_00020 [Candidatus Bathyarchaeota archaeon]|nr:hypothetical protein [Candidatus Bathyarchaeota archaeon]
MREIVLAFLTLLREAVAVIRTNVTRYLIKNNISPFEIPFWKWFTWEFIKTLGLKQLLSLLAIASFTFITFPLGIWISSFSAGSFVPITSIITGIIGMVMFPVNLYSLSKTVHEITFNHQTIMGIVIVEIGTVIGIVGFYFIYLGNRPT